jgi:hypothetical protein
MTGKERLAFEYAIETSVSPRIFSFTSKHYELKMGEIHHGFGEGQCVNCSSQELDQPSVHFI